MPHSLSLSVDNVSCLFNVEMTTNGMSADDDGQCDVALMFTGCAAVYAEIGVVAD